MIPIIKNPKTQRNFFLFMAAFFIIMTLIIRVYPEKWLKYQQPAWITITLSVICLVMAALTHFYLGSPKNKKKYMKTMEDFDRYKLFKISNKISIIIIVALGLLGVIYNYAMGGTPIKALLYVGLIAIILTLLQMSPYIRKKLKEYLAKKHKKK